MLFNIQNLKMSRKWETFIIAKKVPPIDDLPKKVASIQHLGPPGH